MIRYELLGAEALANALRRKNETDYRKIEQKNLLEMRDRAVKSSEPSKGGTPRDTGELRLSASVNADGNVFGYTKDYAPHVEYGHRTVTGGYVRGQYYLRTNTNIQRPIFRKDLVEGMRK